MPVSMEAVAWLRGCTSLESAQATPRYSRRAALCMRSESDANLILRTAAEVSFPSKEYI